MSPSTEYKPEVTIVVTQRERFSFTQSNIESIYEHTQMPFDLVYVDAGSPKHVQRYLTEAAKANGFQVVRLENYLSPNQARNVGLKQVQTKYVVFIDNDVLVTPGWLTRLVACAEQTDAAVVGPTVCIGEPIHQMVHNPGGSIEIKEDWSSGVQVRRFHHKCHFKRKIQDIEELLNRAECDYVEFHCMMVRTDIFNKTGPLDEKLLSTREHLDFCMLVSQAGGRIVAERDVIVTYVPGPPLEWSDLSFFMLRWSDAWDLLSLEHFMKKWNLAEDGYFHKRYDRRGFRRHKAYVKPFAKQLVLGKKIAIVERILIRFDHFINRLVSDRYAQRYPQNVASTEVEPPRKLTAAQSSR